MESIDLLVEVVAVTSLTSLAKSHGCHGEPYVKTAAVNDSRHSLKSVYPDIHMRVSMNGYKWWIPKMAGL